MNLYIGNLDYKVREEQLEEMFAEFGEVTSVKIIKDKFSGRSKGFGFVEMADDNGGKEAINALNGKALLSREIIVSEARPKEDNR